MYRHAVINKNTNKVINVILWDGETKWNPPYNHYIVKSDDAEIGLFYKNNKFIKKDDL